MSTIRLHLMESDRKVQSNLSAIQIIFQISTIFFTKRNTKLPLTYRYRAELKAWLSSFNRFLTCKLSAALMSDVIWSWPTLISPLYIKSTMAWISQPWISLRTITGCLHGVSEKIFWKYGLVEKGREMMVLIMVSVIKYVINKIMFAVSNYNWCI